MDNEKSSPAGNAAPAGSGRAMPKSAPFAAALPKAEGPEPISQSEPLPLTPRPVPAAAPAVEQSDRNGVFAHLVTDDKDIAGLVAYSIYKQHKLDWLTTFEKAKGRTPTDEELASYIIGEGTPRRLATYRHLAEATLAGNGPDVAGGTSGRTVYRRGGLSDKAPLTTGLLAIYALIAVLFLIGFLLAAHYTMSSR